MQTALIIFSVILAVAAAAGALMLSKKISKGASDEAIAELRSEAEALEGQMITLLSDINQQASKGQIQTLVVQTERFISALKEQQQKLHDAEARLTKAQQDVISRELSQQEIKTVRQEDERQLVEVMSNYQDFSSQSVALEHKLAQTLRSLDAMIAENPLNADQRALFQELTNALTNASAQLRDVIVDYQAVYERLDALRRSTPSSSTCSLARSQSQRSDPRF
jgi:alpha-ketoglutarate-dependent taurine dioxygenase